MSVELDVSGLAIAEPAVTEKVPSEDPAAAVDDDEGEDDDEDVAGGAGAGGQ